MQLCPISWQRVKKHPRAQGTSVHVWSWQLKYTTPGSPLLSWFYRVKTMKIRTGPDHLAENQMHVGERALHTHTHTCTGAHNQRDGRGVHSSSERAIDTWKTNMRMLFWSRPSAGVQFPDFFYPDATICCKEGNYCKRWSESEDVREMTSTTGEELKCKGSSCT